MPKPTVLNEHAEALADELSDLGIPDIDGPVILDALASAGLTLRTDRSGFAADVLYERIREATER